MSLIDRLRKGDVESLALLVEECKEVCLKHLVKKTTCNYEEAEDIFTEAVVVFGEKVVAGKVDNVINIKGYMTGVCYNLWLNIYHKKQKEESREPDVERFFYEYMDHQPVDSISNMRERLYDISARAIESLSKSCKEIITYFYLEERSMTDVADLMGFANEKVAKASKYKCFKKLREQVTLLEQRTY